MVRSSHGEPFDSAAQGESDETSRTTPGGFCERDLIELVVSMDAIALEKAAQRLEHADLLTIASFPSQPHVLIHHAASALQAVLISTSLHHQAASIFCITPWSLLRLNLLTHADKIWCKMWKKLAKLRRHAKDPKRRKLSNAQVRFVLQHIIGAALQARHPEAVFSGTCLQLLHDFSRVSSISESIASYVLLCVHYSLVPPVSSCSSPAKSVVLTSIAPSKLTRQNAVAVPTLNKPAFVQNNALVRTSRRSGCKYHGRFFLFRATLTTPSPSALPPAKATGTWSVLAIDRRHAALKWQQSVNEAASTSSESSSESQTLDTQYAQGWTRHVTMPSSIVALLADPHRHCSAATCHSIQLQSAVHHGLFTAPILGRLPQWSDQRLSLGAPPCDQLSLSIHLAVLSVSATSGLTIKAIGKGTIHDAHVTLADLRRQILASMSPSSSSPSSSLLLAHQLPSFQFWLRGVLVPLEEEQWRCAIELVPFSVLCLTCDPQQNPSSSSSLPSSIDHISRKAIAKTWRPWVPTVSKLHRDIAWSLSKHLVPEPSPGPSLFPFGSGSETVVSLYATDQSISVSSSSPLSVCSISSLLTLFLDWNTYVQFQQLQDTTTVFQVSKIKKSTRKKPLQDYYLMSDSNEKLRPDPTPAELERQSLPHKRFRPENEYLRPLYVTLTIVSRTKAVIDSAAQGCGDLAALLRKPNGEKEEEDNSDCPVRLVVGTDECVIHVNFTRQQKQQSQQQRLVNFQRDASCPVEILLSLRQAYVWQIIKLPKSSSKLLRPPLWMRDVLRFVTHPTYDFPSHERSAWQKCPTKRFFRVTVPRHHIEQIVEANFWSQQVDWSVHWAASDLDKDLLRPQYEALCQSHPPSFAIDSVKFSKFLRECGLQPTHLSVGDAAFLFTSNGVAGSSYEMVYDGFMTAMCWIAERVKPATGEDSEDMEPHQQLRLLCFGWLIRAQSMRPIWQGLVNRWRVHEKLKAMETMMVQYCAATRLQANWKRFVVRRRVLETLTLLKMQRLAASKVQSVYKMRRQRRFFLLLRGCAIQTQLFVKARRHLRFLRGERAALVEQMRRRLQKWMRQRLRVLHCWNKINASWLARRARIQEKRSRLVWAAAYQLETRYFRVALYKAPCLSGEGSDDEACYELELLDPQTSWSRSIRVSNAVLEQLDEEAQRVLSFVKPTHARDQKRWRLFVLMQRLQCKTNKSNSTSMSESTRDANKGKDCILHIYRDPLETALGRLVFQGNVVVHHPDDDGYSTKQHRLTSDRVWIVRLLLRGHDCTLVMYTPLSSLKKLFTVTTPFLYRIFQAAHWHGLEFDDDNSDDLAATETSMMMTMETTTRAHAFVVHSLAAAADKLGAIRLVVQFLLMYGPTALATRAMCPEEIAKRAREQRERAEIQRLLEIDRQLVLVVRVQANARRFLARRCVQRLAYVSYTKRADLMHPGRVLYSYHRLHDEFTYSEKPRSLGDQDVSSPIDGWILWSSPDGTTKKKMFFHPLRGIFSAINDVDAALKVQRWFRRVMLQACGMKPWDLRCLTRALLFHNAVKAPTDAADPEQLDQITNYALQRHTLHHDLAPNHPPALVGLAVLLIYSCKYPAKQTWARGLELLARATVQGGATATGLAHSMESIEQNCFRWATFLHAKNANALGNFAVYLQCIRGDLDSAELLYRRAIDLDASNEQIVENYSRLQRERTPQGIFKDAGPSKIAVWRAQPVHPTSTVRAMDDAELWREMEDTASRFPSAQRFYQNTRTGKCAWVLPNENVC